MNYATHEPLTALRTLIGELGQQGGLIGPAIYDTAQVLRFLPTATAPATVAWLLAQQQPDGGWGDPASPQMRDVPTLATILALQAYLTLPHVRAASAAGLQFLAQHAPQHWSAPLGDDLALGIELVLPRLLDETIDAGLAVPQAPYLPLRALGERRHQMIAQRRPTVGATPVYSWEAWGTDCDPTLIDGSGGLGNSPAATAAWIKAAGDRADLADYRTQAQHFLSGAATATGQPAIGLMPTIWPVDRFEQLYGLFALNLAGLRDHPALRDVIPPLAHALSAALGPHGIGSSDYLVPDGDDTATTIAALKLAGYPITLASLQMYRAADRYLTYPHELQPSLMTTAHGVLADALFGVDVRSPVRYLCAHQQPDGRWPGDKWHRSWIYITAQVLIALSYTDQTAALQRGVAALLHNQDAAGGWGFGAQPTTIDTAYAVLALRFLQTRDYQCDGVQAAVARAQAWLFQQYGHAPLSQQPYWVAKELYCPNRNDAMFILCAMLASDEHLHSDVHHAHSAASV